MPGLEFLTEGENRFLGNQGGMDFLTRDIEPNEQWTDPVTQEITTVPSIDWLAESFLRTREQIKLLKDHETRLRRRMCKLTELAGIETKTRRLQGENFRIRVTMPDDQWDQAFLKRAFEVQPDTQEAVKTKVEYRVGLREWRKIKNMTGDKKFEYFRDTLNRANLGPSHYIAIKIEGQDDK